MVDRYNSRYSTEESAHIKAVRRRPISYLETTCQIHHIYKELNVLISQTREKSAAGDSAEPKQ
jgi:hypothetical protein